MQIIIRPDPKVGLDKVFETLKQGRWTLPINRLGVKASEPEGDVQFMVILVETSSSNSSEAIVDRLQEDLSYICLD